MLWTPTHAVESTSFTYLMRSKKLGNTLRENPNVKGVEIRKKISRKWNINTSKCMTYREKSLTSDQVDR